MYFRFSLRHNPAKGKSDAYYRLIKSYRNEIVALCNDDTVCSIEELQEVADELRHYSIFWIVPTILNLGIVKLL